LRSELAAAQLVPLFQGSWRYVDLRYLWSRLPYGLVRLPSHIFVLTYSTAAWPGLGSRTV
jgi:hypothetical protein